MTADTSKSLDLHAHPEVGASPAASKDAPTDDVSIAILNKLADGPHTTITEARALKKVAAHVAALTAKLEAERARAERAEAWASLCQQDRDTANDTLENAIARADAAVAEAKALREALFTIKRGHVEGDFGGLTFRPLRQSEIEAIVDRATLAQSRSDSECDLPAADGGK